VTAGPVATPDSGKKDDTSLSGRFLGRLLATWPAVAIGALLIALTPPPGMGDTNWYVSDVLMHRSGRYAGPFDPLLEFGHVVWRPLGDALYPIAALVPDSIAAGMRMKLAVALSWFSAGCGLLAAALMFDIVFRLSRSRLNACFIAACFLCADASLTYFETGNSYVPGLLFVTLALWFALESGRNGEPGTLLAALSGISVGVAVLFWFANVLVVPAIVLCAVVWNTPDWRLPRNILGARWRSAAAAAVGCALVVVIGYGIASLAGHIRTVDQFIDWYRSADHGWAQNRTWLRAVSGFPRMLFSLSGDGILLKRFAFHDPYAAVPITRIVVQILWKLGLFYLCLALTFWSCRRGKRQQEGGAVLGAALACLGFFAIVLFEPSTPSRFIALLPFFFLAVTLASPVEPGRRMLRLAIVAAPLTAAIFNVWSFTFAN
jgi:hypothetical protein